MQDERAIPEPGTSKRVAVHMIGNAHIDHAWLWRWPEARAEVLATCRSALDRMREFPEFVFSFSSAVSYEWIEADDAEMFAEIKRRIAEGRWNVVGGWYVQPDCNLPHGESFVRQAIYGLGYFREKLGVEVKVGYNVDSFGHAGTLPMLLAGAGFDSYVFFRPKPHEKELPDGAFWWQSPDGSRVLTCRPPLHYNSRESDLTDRVREALAETPSAARSGQVMCFYGVGNHGGGPTIRNIESILATRQTLADADVLFSTPDAYFAAVRGAVPVTAIPTVAEELQYHSVGCFSVLDAVKRGNRAAEHALMAAERLATVATAAGAPYPKAELDEAWKLVLFDQFHDTIAGTCIPEVYDDVRADYARVAELVDGIVARSLDALTADTNTAGLAQPIVVANSLPWSRRGTADLTLYTQMSQTRLLGRVRRPTSVRLTDERGEVVPAQITSVAHTGAGYRVEIVADLDLPGLGYRTLDVEFLDDPTPSVSTAPVAAEARDFELRNEHLVARIDRESGWLTSLVDRTTGAELLAGPAAVPVVLDDPSDTWSHAVAAYRDEIGRFAAQGDVQLVQSGPLRQTVRARYRWGASVVEQEFSLDADAREVRVVARADWHEHWRMLKLAFPFAVKDPVATSESPYGRVTRPPTGHEEPTQSWVSVSGRLDAPDGGVSGGVALLNDGKGAYDVLGSELRLTVLRSPAFAFHEPRAVEPDVEYTFIDQGEQHFSYALAPRVGEGSDADVPRRAWDLNEPVVVRSIAPRLGARDSAPRGFLTVEPASVVAAVVKRAESGDGVVVRLHETVGRTTRARLAFAGFGPDTTVEVDLGAHAIETLLWRAGQLARVNLLEEG